MSSSFISIGESIHASIPRTGKIMKQLAELGPDAYATASEPLDYIKSLIESQAEEGADYIAVNLDAFGEDESQVAVDMMVEYVKMVRNWVLIAGLKEWFDTDESVKQPLINSVKLHTIETMLGLKKDYDFTFVGMLMPESGQDHGVDELFSIAQQIFGQAVNTYGFKAEEIFFDTTIFPLAIDMPMQPEQPSYTYKTFETIKKIKNDPQMQNCHFTGGISNCARDLPARKVGVMRAFVHRTMECGMDSGIVSPKHHLDEGQADAELLKLVDAFAAMDGSADKLTDAMMLMGEFCQANRK
jgi:cobalamin-dependent methionine synthase I